MCVIGSWGWGRQESAPEMPIPHARTVHKGFEVMDSKRQCLNLWASPAGQYAAMSDALGRVVLIDVLYGAVLHIWKG